MAGFFKRLLGGERKATVLESLPALLYGFGRETKSGRPVSVASALEVSTVLACARVIAEGVAQVPLKLYRPMNGGRSEVTDHPLARVFGDRPNIWQTPFEFRETLLYHLVLTGNAFAYINRVGGEIFELMPLEPGSVTVEKRRDQTLAYTVTGPDGRFLRLGPEIIWHLRGPSWCGWLGLDVVKLAREAIGLAMATEEAHAQLHANGSQPGGLYSVEGTLNAEQYKILSGWVEKTVGGSNRFKPLILDRTAKWTSTAMSGVDAQHLETRRYQVEEICRFMRVLPIMVGHSGDKTPTYASAEQLFLAHVIHTLTPWCTRIEQQVRTLLGPDERGITPKHLLNGLLRGAAKDRSEFYSKALGSGGSPAWMTPNEVRALEEMDPIEGGDVLPQPQAAARQAGA